MGTRIVFTGDISFSKFFANAWEKENLLAPEIRTYLRDADHTVANVECALTDRSIESSRVLNHACSPNAGAFLRDAGMRCWSLANNHIMDCGADGMLDTVQCARDNGCQWLGVGENLAEAARPVMLGEDVRIGILSLAKPWTYLIAGEQKPGALTWEQTSAIKQGIDKLRADGADWVVLIVHGGDEYASVPLPYMRERYHALLGLGADIIVAHHPHVVQNYECPAPNKAIFYSLGNFIFDTENQRTFAHTDTGVLLGVNFEKDAFAFDHLAVRIDHGQNTVVCGETPAIFCEISAEDYQKIWPLAAKCFYPVDLKNRKNLHPKIGKYAKPVLFAHEVFVCRHRREREIQCGRMLAAAGKWKTAGCKEAVQYIQG